MSAYLLVLPLPGHLLAPPDQRVEVDVLGRVHVELGRLPVLKTGSMLVSRAYFSSLRWFFKTRCCLDEQKGKEAALISYFFSYFFRSHGQQ